MECLYCPTTLGNERWAHVVASALGGRLQNRHTECSTCNWTFGNGIEKRFLSGVEHIRRAIGLWSGRGELQEPATVVVGERRFLLHRGWVRPIGRTETRFPDGSVQLSLSDSLQHAAQETADRLAQKRKTFAELVARDGIWIDQFDRGHARIDLGASPVAFNTGDLFRLAVKAVLNLIGHAWPHVARRPELRSSRCYVATGRAPADNRLSLNFSCTPYGGGQMPALGDWTTGVECWASGPWLYAQFLALGHFSVVMRFGRVAIARPFRAHYAFDPTSRNKPHVKFVDESIDLPPIPVSWFDGLWDFEARVFEERFALSYQRLRERSDGIAGPPRYSVEQLLAEVERILVRKGAASDAKALPR